MCHVWISQASADWCKRNQIITVLLVGGWRGSRPIYIIFNAERKKCIFLLVRLLFHT